MIFKRALPRWLRCLTVEISDVPCATLLRLWAYHQENWELSDLSSEWIVAKSFSNVNFSGKNFKSAMLIKFYT